MSIEITSVSHLQDVMQAMTISPLRGLARQYGIVPGNKKRAELESEITNVFLGKVTPTRRIKTGRPTRSDNTAVSKVCQPHVDEEADEEIVEVQPIENIVEGVLDIMADGYGFLRVTNYANGGNKDVYVPPAQIKRFNLKMGDKVKGNVRIFDNKSAPSLIYIHNINDGDVQQHFKRVSFDSLMPCNPNERLTLENGKAEYALRAIDLVAPIGKGQRGLIVAPPKTGKTILLKKIAQAIQTNHPDVHLVVLLIDERPEEVTDFMDSVSCEVAYSTFDQTPQHHIQVAELVINNAKRRVEQGQDVMILMDSITRLARAYNQVADNSGRTLTGGLDISALQEPKKLFGAGRNVKGGGSLTLLATALINTGSKLDDIVYEEFKGTGNMEIHLDRRMSEKRIFPAIDLQRSGTRREELLLTQSQLEAMYLMRKALSTADTVKATEELLDMMTCTNNNNEFVESLKIIATRGKAKTVMAKH